MVGLRDGVREGHVDLNGFRDEVFYLAQHPKIVLGLDIVRIRRV